MDNSVLKFDKVKMLYVIIAILILVIFGKSIFASDDDKLKDSLTQIDNLIKNSQDYKVKVAEELKKNVDEANKQIQDACSTIPESTKKAVDCKKFIQTYEIKIWTSTGGIAPVPERLETQEGVAEDSVTLREALNLKDCRFTNDHHKFPRDNISFQAVDIACIKWESFEVYTPNWKDQYEVTSIWYGANLWNYVILRSWDYHLVYWHTVADKNLKVGQKLGKKAVIGKTNVSGESTGLHLHFELWEGWENLNGRFMVRDNAIYSPDSEKLLNKRWWNWAKLQQDKQYWQSYEKAISILHSEEWLRLKAYPDYKWCSIGYGSRATSCDEEISEAEANRRLAYIVRDLTERVQEKFSKLGPDAQANLVSFAYNCHKGYQDVIENGIQQHEIWCKKAGGVRLDTLVERRAKETEALKADKNYNMYEKK